MVRSNIVELLKVFLSGISGFIIHYTTQAPEFVKDLWVWAIFLFVIDTIIGFSFACYAKKVNSNKLRRGGVKLLSYLSLLFVAAGLDSVIHTQYLIANIIASYIILTETISILENIRMAGIPVPKFIVTLTDRILDTLEKQCDSIVKEDKSEKESE
ncbi:MAG: Holin family protein [Firmicutes bacterium ADurb.Bin419]|nr:MAG: Holin family protein [Firmicutes bacterium ADurb.Bin419]